MKAAVSGVRKLQTTQYKNADEYKKAQDELSEKLQGIIKSWNLDGSDVRQLNIGIADAVKLSNKEIKDFDKNMSEIQGKWTDTISILQKCALNEDDPSKIGFIKSLTNQFNSVSSKAYNYCAKHPASVVAATLAAAGGTAIAVSSSYATSYMNTATAIRGAEYTNGISMNPLKRAFQVFDAKKLASNALLDR